MLPLQKELRRWIWFKTPWNWLRRQLSIFQLLPTVGLLPSSFDTLSGTHIVIIHGVEIDFLYQDSRCQERGLACKIKCHLILILIGGKVWRSNFSAFHLSAHLCLPGSPLTPPPPLNEVALQPTHFVPRAALTHTFFFKFGKNWLLPNISSEFFEVAGFTTPQPAGWGEARLPRKTSTSSSRSSRSTSTKWSSPPSSSPDLST